MVYPANQLELIETFKIPRMQRADGNGQRFIGCVFAAVNDMLVEACATLVRSALLYDVNPKTEEFGYEQPYAAIELLGQEALLPLYPGELHSSLVTQLRRKWDHYSGGVKEGLESELARAGYDATISVPNDEDLSPTIVVNGTATASTGAGNLSINSAVQRGDLMIFQVETANEPIARPFGWTTVATAGVGTAGAGGTRIQVFKKLAERSDEPNIEFADPGDHWLGRVTIVRGGDFDLVGASIATSADADVTAVSVGGNDSQRRQSLVLLCLAHGADISGANVSAQANAALTDIAEGGDNSVTTGNGGGLSHTSGKLADVGSAGTWTATLATAARWAAVSLTIAPFAYWSRFWVDVVDSPLTDPGLSFGAHRVGLDRLGPAGVPENYLETLRSIIARNKPHRWIHWQLRFPLADGSGTVRILNPLVDDATHVYFS